jgi:hypothetical protein
MYPIDKRFFDAVGYSEEGVMIWGFRSYDDENGSWYVSYNDAREFLAAIGGDLALAEI